MVFVARLDTQGELVLVGIEDDNVLQVDIYIYILGICIYSLIWL